MRRQLVVVGAVLALAIGGWACGDPDPQEDADTGFARPAPSQSIVASPVDDGTRGDGTFEVGASIVAGKWTTMADGLGYGCYWARRKDASGQVESIIANGFVPKGAPGIVQIAASDKFVEFSGGCRWKPAV
jgi:hypothetical protein